MHKNQEEDSTEASKTGQTLVGLVWVEKAEIAVGIVWLIWNTTESFVGQGGLRHWLLQVDRQV